MQQSGTQTLLRIERIELPTPFPVGSVNAYLVQSDDARVLIDCGPKYPQSNEALVRGLAHHGYAPSDLSALVLTHGHVDHVGLTHIFQAAGVRVCAPPGVEMWLTPNGHWDRYRHEFFETLYGYCGVPTAEIQKSLRSFQLLQSLNDRSVVDTPLEYDKPLPVMPNFHVLHVPGHAQHALALWDEDGKILFGGDQVLQHVSSNPMVEPDMTADSGREAHRTRSLLQYRSNLLTLRDLGIETIYPGHGEPFADVNERIEKMLSEQLRRKAKFLRLMSEDTAYTAYELATSYFPRHRDQLSLILSETIGYLDWMTEEGVLLEAADARGVGYWRRNPMLSPDGH